MCAYYISFSFPFFTFPSLWGGVADEADEHRTVPYSYSSTVQYSCSTGVVLVDILETRGSACHMEARCKTCCPTTEIVLLFF
ncbi:hypothetical protein HOY80DRAFT_403112 [Tuber brumale]|nr:hypothetical protein HOY80DRAFT_403112 [Tuber brumale]